MAIKDILLALSMRSEHDSGRSYALSMASQLGAKATGVIYAIEPPVSFSIYPDFTSQLLEGYRTEMKKNVEEAHKRFKMSATELNVAHEFHTGSGRLDAAISDFTKRVRASDLAVLAQHETVEMKNIGDVFLEAALFHSGRPLIIVPKDNASEFSIARVLVAWDGSAHAARAVSAATPLLERAGKILVLTIKEDDKSSDLGGHELVNNLRLHNLNAELSERNDTDIAATIVEETEMFRASLVVMGGYGHSRLREFVMGGATRLMLRIMPVPVLMAH